VDDVEIIPRGRLAEIITRQETINTSLTDLESAEDTDETRLRADGLLEEFG
jgi:hypothetical protein